MEEKYSIYFKIKPRYSDFSQSLAMSRFKGKKIVFTNGCFDILHRGHVEYLNQASRLGDILVVGLNTDDSVKRIKGPERPVVDQQSRAIVLSALEFIDFIVLFDEDTPYELIKNIKPDVLVKGNDYDPDEIVGADILKSYGGKVITVPLVEGFSTTDLISKLKKN